MLRLAALLALSVAALADWFEDDSLGSDAPEPAAKDPLLAFSGADLEDFEATLSCALDGGCEMWHAELRGNSTTDENALPCLVDAACAAKYSALAKRMQRAPCDPRSACPGGQCGFGARMQRTIRPPECSSLILGRMSRGGVLGRSGAGALYVGEVRSGLLHGVGKLRRGADVVVGTFDGGLFVGPGLLLRGGPGGAAFEGERFTDGGSALDGRGRFTPAGGKGAYRGEVRRGRAHGRGVVTAPSGAEYDGAFENGRIKDAAAARALNDAEVANWEAVLAEMSGGVSVGGFVSAMFGGSWDVALILIILCIGIPLALSDANFDAIPDAPTPPTIRIKERKYVPGTYNKIK